MTFALASAISSLIMLHINDLTYRIEGRLILDHATAAIPEGHKVGLVGRNGAGKTTLMKLLVGELSPETGGTSMPKNARIGMVAQEAPGGPESLIDWTLSQHKEREALLAEAETATDPNRIGDIHTRLADIGAHSAPARAATILSGLGFDDEAQKRSCASYSGGWRMRVALGAMLFLEPDVLLLDEPTNYLDLEGTLWLEQHLKTYPHTVLMISHDRDLLNRAVDQILHLERGKITLYSGGYDDFENTRREQQRLQLKLKGKQDHQRKHMQAFVDRFRAKASKAKQAQSRLKALERMQPIADIVDDQVRPFNFPTPAKGMGNPLIRLDDVNAGYEPGKPILHNLTLRLDSDDRIGLLGENGNGKSTFAKLIAGRLAPLHGRRIANDKIVVGFFAQHQMEDLPSGMTPYDHMCELMPDGTEAQRRARLGVIGFGADKADTIADRLSGGEKARLLFAIATFHKPHLLILDEPTNHLDVDSRQALVLAINDYEGCVILISHDRHLIEATADRLWLVRGGTVAPYDGDLETYRKESLAAKEGRKKGRMKAGADVDASAAGRGEARREGAGKRVNLGPLKKRIATAEKLVGELTAELALLDRKLGDAGLYKRDPVGASILSRERGTLAKKLAAAEAEWMAASEALEGVGV